MIGVLNTRPRIHAARLSELLREAGYRPLEAPLVELVLLPEGVEAFSRLSPGEYDGILISSPNLLPLLAETHPSALNPWISKPWYSISRQAVPQIEALGGRVAFVPREASLRGFYKEFPPQPGLRILHLCSGATRLETRPFLEREVVIRNLALYSPRVPEGLADDLPPLWPQVRAVLFGSGSAVRNLFAAAPELAATLGARGHLPVSIGPSATEALIAQGVVNARQAESSDNEGLVAALNAEFHPNTPEESHP